MPITCDFIGSDRGVHKAHLLGHSLAYEHKLIQTIVLTVIWAYHNVQGYQSEVQYWRSSLGELIQFFYISAHILSGYLYIHDHPAFYRVPMGPSLSIV